MTLEKRQLLDRTFQTFMEVGLGAGNLDILDDIVARDVVGFGTTIDEKLFGIKELQSLLIRQKEQSSGMELSWKINTLDIHISADENSAIFTNEIFLYITESENPIEMYMRFSVVLEYVQNKWLVVHWHGSKPEHVESEKDTWGIQTWKEKAESLEKEVAERTADLVEKNKELSIEAALEKVRAVAMGMKKPEDMLDVCRIISLQLLKFDVNNIRNVQTAIINENIGQYICYQFFPSYDKTTIENTQYHKSPVEHEMVKQMLESRDGHFIGTLTDETLEEFKLHRKKENQLPDPLLDNVSEISYCFLSIGEGGLGLSLYQSMDENVLILFKRFHQVFSLAYQRFRDIQKAEAQAKDAQIEAALERVRAQTMAMHSSEDVGKCIIKMFSELTALGVDENTRFGIGILNHENENNELWTARKDGEEVKMHIGNLDMTLHPLLISARKAWKEQLSLHRYVLVGQDLLNYYQMLNNAPDYKILVPIEKLPEREFHYGFVFEHGFFYAFSRHEFQPDLIHITKRFSSLFEQTYRRYLDLVRAEAQAREAEIELALERVRARTMAMHHTEELKEVIQVVFDQFVGLNIHVDHAGFILDYKEREDMHIWLTDHHQGVPTEITIPYFDSPHWNSYNEAKAKQESFFANLLPFEVKNKFYRGLFEWIPELTEEAQQAIFSKPGLAISTVLLDNVGLYIEHYSETPFSTEENKILMRFGKVFQQTYTRFLDLQKAEVQAKEAQIEAALERIRARTMGMHRSEELTEVIHLVFSEMKRLEFDINNAGILVDFKENDDFHVWMADSYSEFPFRATIPFFDHPFNQDYLEQKESGNQLFMKVYSKSEKDSWFEGILPSFTEPEPQIKTLVLSLPALAITRVFINNIGLYIYNYSGELYSESENSTLIRMAKVFEQAYTRFLDLQKAEAQAREAQIEAAMERVRSRSMAMHKSEELLDAGEIIFVEMQKLGIESLTAGLVLMDKEEKNGLNYVPDPSTHKMFHLPVIIPHDETKHLRKVVEKWKKGSPFFIVEMDEDETIQHQTFIAERSTNFSLTAAQLIAISPARLFLHNFYFKEGYVLIVGASKLTGEQTGIMLRFAKVFQQTYTRFLDLKKAEDQAREAQIEAALERVRSRSMAMHKSEEFPEVIQVVFEQFQQLDFKIDSAQFDVSFRETDDLNLWTAAPGQPYPTKLHIPYADYEVFNSIKKAKKAGLAFVSIQLTKEEKNDFFNYFFLHAPNIPEERKKFLLSSPGVIRSVILLDSVSLAIQNYSGIPYTDAEHAILKRFAKAFEQIYTRFLDLQNAEAQTRESQIQLALERVRARTMAMQHSDELPEAANLLFQQVQSLGMPAWSAGYCTWNDDEKRAITLWMSSEGVLQPPFTVPTTKDELFIEMRKGQEDGKSFHVVEMGGKKLVKHYQYMRTLPVVGKILDSIIEAGHPLPTFQIMHHAYFSKGFLLFITYESVPDAHNIFQRFGKVFDQTYTRFLDLQKAESQAREAQIEASLERVRSTSLAMHTSQDLSKVVYVVFTELVKLDAQLDRCLILTVNPKTLGITWYLTGKEGLLSNNGFLVENNPHPSHQAYLEGWRTKRKKWYYLLEGEEKKSSVEYLFSKTELAQLPDFIKADMAAVESIHLTISSDDFGCLIASSISPLPEAYAVIVDRFTSVFNQTYTRFLDLQRAEVQTWDAKVEAALEKVRSRSLAMQSPEELIEVAQMLREEMGALGVEELETSSIYIHDDDSNKTQCWFTIKDSDIPSKAVTDQMTIDLQDTWVGRKMLDFYRSPSNQTSILMQGKQRIEWIRYCEEKTELFGSSNFYGESIPDRTYHLYKFSNGFIGAAAPGKISTESWELMKRATAVFSFAYTRFRDLQMAEASATTAMRQASLDRVRAEISSMRHAADLDRITPLFFHELTTLGIPFIRCGVFIVHEKQKIIESYLSSPDGNSLGVLRLPFQASELTQGTVEAWRKGMIYRQHWNKEDFIQWINLMMEQDQIQDSRTYQGAAAPPESLDLHFVPFTQGMLYVGAENPLDEKELELVQALAKAFSIAYSRYEDFVKLEQAKAEVELAMNELKATQSQLVQQEKLASLGQLTAGIAHEIKNPLNFVNNFSEVSIEMIEEALEEIEKREARDETLIRENLEDIRSNLKKVHEHGSRANSIVSSMLQHSRGGTRKKEPTDLNAMIKEYINLSFHGMRAGKSAIDVDIIFELDYDIKEVLLIREDFTRVIINLCNNAFDAMRSKKYELGSSNYKVGVELGKDYLPQLRVSSVIANGEVTISFEDNGQGIPDEIKDKILQPFFTTKKGTEGTGLGLSITHDIVKAHGGELKIETEPEMGARFIISLPKKP
jgi:signal transduction histidine kinase